MITVGAAGPVCKPGDDGQTVRQPGGRAHFQVDCKFRLFFQISFSDCCNNMITVGAAGPVCEPGDGGQTVRQPGERAQLLRHHPQEDHPGMLFSRFMFHVPDGVRIRIQMGEWIRIQTVQSLSPRKV